MELKTKGVPFGINKTIVGVVNKSNIYPNSILVQPYSGKRPMENTYILATTGLPIAGFRGIYAIPNLNHLTDGDVVVLNTDGVVNTIYRVESNHNFLLFTERCNSNCLMCSQPPRDRDDTSYFYDLYSEAIPLITKSCAELGITGGEPTLLGERFFQLLELLQLNLPETEVHCLTNGRSFAWKNLSDRLGNLSYKKLMLGIPIYADYADVHDYVVQAKGAFQQTVLGLHHLAENNVRIELRIVLHQQTIPRLKKLSRFIYKNLPFAEHVTFMALENQGYTPHNISKLWIDPIDYAHELEEAMHYLADFGMNVSLYNSQLCTTPESLWQFSRKSISDWKNIYLGECEKCEKLDACGGFFASNKLLFSRGIKSF
jgi:His-Xaa-Ser system radical SAM maturase HxsC